MPLPGPEKKRVSLKELIRWSYARQMVHLRDSGPDPRDDIHLNGRVRDSLARLDMVGHGSIGAVPLTFHPDAEAVHEAVLGLGEVDSLLQQSCHKHVNRNKGLPSSSAPHFWKEPEPAWSSATSAPRSGSANLHSPTHASAAHGSFRPSSGFASF